MYDNNSKDIRQSLKERNVDLHVDKDVKYYAAFVPLKEGDETLEAIVYWYNELFCGSAGCNTLILRQDNKGDWKSVSEIGLTRPPILVLESRSHGWRSIGVCLYGGGIGSPGYEAELPYDGESYPSDPGVPPARPLQSPYRYQVVIPPDKIPTPVYPPQIASPGSCPNISGPT